MKKELKDYVHLYLGCDINTGGQIERLKSVDENGNIETLFRGHLINYYNINDYECKLILRPLSSLSNEEAANIGILPKKEWYESTQEERIKWLYDNKDKEIYSPKDFMYLLSIGIDLFNLIESGLAIDTTLK